MTYPRPEPLSAKALHGLAGEFVDLVLPHSEADQAGLLVQFLVAFGNVMGGTPHFVAEADKHRMNLYTVLVGKTSKGRKGSSWGQVRRLFEHVDPTWAQTRIQGGLSSGEGLIWAVRDPIIKAGKEGEEVVADPGVEDKRLMLVESEFASTLKVMTREGNTLSPIVRNAWDRGDIQSLTKNSPAKATRALISIVGHITESEATRYLTATEAANGFGNRFLWICVERSKTLPEGGRPPEEGMQSLSRMIQEALSAGRRSYELRRDDEARALWYEVYGGLSEGQPGLYGALIARAEAQVMRVASLYALLDSSELIRRPHLEAGLEVWRYSEQSTLHVFGDSMGDPTSDAILRALRNQLPEGLSRTQIRDLFQRNKSKGEINRALALLLDSQLAFCREQPTDGRTAEIWFAGRQGDAHKSSRSSMSYSSTDPPPPSSDVDTLDEEAREERAAIMEMDAGLSREEAERRAGLTNDRQP